MLIRTTVRRVSSLITTIFPSFSQGVLPKYHQKPWPPEAWLTLNKNCTLKDSMHGGWLMAKGVLPFSYDGYEQVCIKAVHCQAELCKEDILMLISLGVKYQVRLQPFCQNIQNELFLRIHRDYQLDMLDYEEQITKELQEMYAKFEKQSKDFFSLLKQEEEQGQQLEEGEQKDEQQEQKIVIPLESKPPRQVEETEKIVSDLNARYIINKKKQFTLKDIILVADLLQRWGCTNLELMQYLQELLTVKLQNTEVDADTTLSYIKFLTHVCQSLFKEYQDNRKKYTHRSIKRLYKYQYFYYHEHFRHLISSDSTSSPQFLEILVKQYAAFPIKRRQLRKKIGIYVSSQMKKFNMTHREDLLQLLMDINKKDEKMKKMYRSLLGLPEPEPVVKQIVEETRAKSLSEGQSEGEQASSEKQ